MNRGPELFDALAREIASAPTGDLPDLIGFIARLQAQAELRLRFDPMPIEAANDDEDRLLTIRETADRLHVSERFVKKHRAEFAPVRLGRSIRFPRRAVDNYIRRKSRSL